LREKEVREALERGGQKKEEIEFQIWTFEGVGREAGAGTEDDLRL